jgi:pectate lyase C
MKKTSLIILSLLCITALSIWFGCNPFQQSKAGINSNFSVLDESNGARLTISTVILINGSTWDGGGQSIVTSGLEQALNDNPAPVFMVTNGTLKNFTLSEAGNDGIYLEGGNCTIDNLIMPAAGEVAIHVKKAGTTLISNCTIKGNYTENILQVNDINTVTSQSNNIDTSTKYLRQNGGKTWKMISYCNDCSIMNISSAIFRSDAPDSTFYYHNLTTNCGTIGYPGTNVVPY